MLMCDLSLWGASQAPGNIQKRSWGAAWAGAAPGSSFSYRLNTAVPACHDTGPCRLSHTRSRPACPADRMDSASHFGCTMLTATNRLGFYLNMVTWSHGHMVNQWLRLGGRSASELPLPGYKAVPMNSSRALENSSARSVELKNGNPHTT